LSLDPRRDRREWVLSFKSEGRKRYLYLFTIDFDRNEGEPDKGFTENINRAARLTFDEANGLATVLRLHSPFIDLVPT
jgi:hypothetical protein